MLSPARSQRQVLSMSEASSVRPAAPSTPRRGQEPPDWWSEVAERFGFLRAVGWDASVSSVSPDARPTLHDVAARLGAQVTDLAGASVVAPLFETKIALGLA